MSGPAMRKKHHVLLVEDDRLTRTIVCDQLRACEYSVTIAENGETALKLLTDGKIRVTVDLVLTDLLMPRVNGSQLIDKLKSTDKWKNTPVVVMSSNDSAEDIASLIGLGAVEYMVKPVARARLLSMSRHITPRSAEPAAPNTSSNTLAAKAPQKAAVRPSPPLTMSSGDSEDTKPSVAQPPLAERALLRAIDGELAAGPFGAEAERRGSTPWPALQRSAPAGVSGRSATAPAGTQFKFEAGQRPVLAVTHKHSRAAGSAQGAMALRCGNLPPFAGPQASPLVSLGWQSSHAHNHQAALFAVQQAHGDGAPVSTPESRRLALERFRAKKAKRDYSKTVRYVARKKLAEQRPRYKGQFVKMRPEEPPV